jgi:hypothetical protein
MDVALIHTRWGLAPAVHGSTGSARMWLTQAGGSKLGDLLGEPMHDHAPTRSTDRVGVISLEDHMALGDAPQLGPFRCRKHDRLSVKDVVDRQDLWNTSDHEADAADLLGGGHSQAVFYLDPADASASVDDVHLRLHWVQRLAVFDGRY